MSLTSVHNPDHSIDKVLTGLRNTPSPTHLEARIHARLAHAEASAPQQLSLSAALLQIAKLPRTLLVSPIRLATVAAVCITIVVTLSHHHSHTITITSTPTQSIAAAHTPTTAHAPRTSTPGSHPPHVTSAAAPSQPLATTQSDPDAIALAETLAPSHPAPPLPLTSQEALLLRSTRQGQPIELAELETRRESAISTIAAIRERIAVREYVHSLLGPLAAAERLAPSPAPTQNNAPAIATEPPPSR